MDDLENYLHVLDGQNKELILTGDCDLSLSVLQSHVGLWTFLNCLKETSDRWSQTYNK